MHDLVRLRDMLVKELEAFGKNGNISKNSLDTIDKLAHATKNVMKVVDGCSSDDYKASKDSELNTEKFSDESVKKELIKLIERM